MNIGLKPYIFLQKFFVISFVFLHCLCCSALAAADSTNQLLNQFMAQQYGPYDRENDGWHRSDQDTSNKLPDGIFHVCAESDKLDGSDAIIVLVACGEPFSAIHSTPGLEDLYVIRRNGDGKFKILSSLKDLKNGSWGIPGDFDIKKFGNSVYGIVETTNFTNNGFSNDFSIFYVIIDNIIYPASQITTKMNDIDACHQPTPLTSVCENIKVSWRLDPSKNVMVWPLIVDLSGQRDGRSISKCLKIFFNLKSHQYEFPQELKRTY